MEEEHLEIIFNRFAARLLLPDLCIKNVPTQFAGQPLERYMQKNILHFKAYIEQKAKELAEARNKQWNTVYSPTVK